MSAYADATMHTCMHVCVCMHVCAQSPTNPLLSLCLSLGNDKLSWKRHCWQGSKCPMHSREVKSAWFIHKQGSRPLGGRAGKFLCLSAPLTCTGRKRHLSPHVTRQGHKQLIFNKGQKKALFDIPSNRKNKLGLTTRCILKCWLLFTLQHRLICEASGWRCWVVSATLA